MSVPPTPIISSTIIPIPSSIIETPRLLVFGKISQLKNSQDILTHWTDFFMVYTPKLLKIKFPATFIKYFCHKNESEADFEVGISI